MRQWFYISTKAELMVAHIELLHTFLNIFFTETTGLIKLKFHMKYLLDKTL